MNVDLLREAAEWRLLSLLLECPNGIWRAQVCDLSKTVDDPLLRSAACKALEEANEGLYHSAFGPGGPAPPREVSYSDSVQLGYLVSEIEAYYDAFAYRPRTCEAADHISVEAGFVSFLLMKEAFAGASGGCGFGERHEGRKAGISEAASGMDRRASCGTNSTFRYRIPFFCGTMALRSGSALPARAFTIRDAAGYLR